MCIELAFFFKKQKNVVVDIPKHPPVGCQHKSKESALNQLNVQDDDDDDDEDEDGEDDELDRHDNDSVDARDDEFQHSLSLDDDSGSTMLYMT
jgi:phosphopantothenoylcysteine synthetase/decarboxylase